MDSVAKKQKLDIDGPIMSKNNYNEINAPPQEMPNLNFSRGASARGLVVIDNVPDASQCHRRHDGIKVALYPDGDNQFSDVKQDGITNELCQLLHAKRFKVATNAIPNMIKSDLNRLDEHGDAAVHLSFGLEQHDIVRMLATHGASLDIQKSEGKRIFHLVAAKYRQKQQMVSLSRDILEHSYVDLPIRDNDNDC